MNNYTLILILIIVIVIYFAFRKPEQFSVDNKQKQCSDIAIDKSILGYQINVLNQHKLA
jgi:preprotein translocase subunit YajC